MANLTLRILSRPGDVTKNAPLTYEEADNNFINLDADIQALGDSLGGKEPSISAGTTSQYFRGDKSWQTLNKSAVGLANVDNTSVVYEPVSTAQASAISASTANNTHSATGKTTPVDADELGVLDSAASWGLKKLTFANLKTWIASLFVSRTSAQIDGNLNITGAGRRITGNFSNTTIGDRLMLQTNVTGDITAVEAIPNGSGVVSQFNASTSSDPNNASSVQMRIGLDTGDARISSEKRGAGVYLPLSFHAGGAERLRINTAGNVGIGDASPVQKLVVNQSIPGGNPATSGTGNDPNVIARFAYGIVGLDFGGYTSGSSWIQNRLTTDYSANLPLLLNPNGGNIGIGTNAPTAKLDIKDGSICLSTAANSGGRYGINRYDSSSINGMASLSLWGEGTNRYLGAFAVSLSLSDFHNSPLTDVFKVSTAGALVTAPVPLGYGVGTGGTVTQSTSKGTAVTLNKPSGKITTHAGSIAANSTAHFIVNNTFCNADCVVSANIVGGTGNVNAYTLSTFPFANGFYVSIRNQTAGALGDALQIQFNIIKGSTS